MPIPTSHKSLLSLQTAGQYRLCLDANAHVNDGHGHSAGSCITSNIVVRQPPFRPFWSFRLGCSRLGGAFLLCLTFVIFVAHTYDIASREPQLRASVYISEYRSAFNQRVTPPLDPEGVVVADTELFYMLPSAEKPTVGLLIHFHGCGHAGQDMFRLPEERIIVRSALRRGLAVLSITSANRKTGCWSTHDVDHLNQHKVVDRWMESLQIDPSIPKIGIGASSGGSILFSMHQILALQSMATYVVSRVFDNEQLALTGDNVTSHLPPTAFIHMPKDPQTIQDLQLHEHLAALQALGVPTKLFRLEPHPFTLEQCDQRLPEIGDRRCQIFLNKVKKRYPTLIDEDNNVLQPYHDGSWEQAFEDTKLDDDLRHIVGSPLPTRGDLNPIHFSGHSWAWIAMAEELSVSYAGREITSEYHEQVLDFLMDHAGIRFQSEYHRRRRRGLLGVVAHLLMAETTMHYV